MTRVALYARYSSDNQSIASIEDQLRICREQAARDGWKIVGTYHDAAISGASVILRLGIQSLLQDAQRGKFDVVLAEALDRISRDQADVATLFKHLRFAGVGIVTMAEGEITELHVGLKGTMNALFLKDLAAKTHRGIRGRVEKGKSGGGLCYGYDVVKRIDAEGEPVRGERTIDEVEAGIVRRIFRAFAAGVIHPNIADIYRRKVERLAEALRNPQERDEAADAIRALIDRITLTPGSKRGEIKAMLHGDLGTILEWAGRKENAPGRESSGVSVSVVAGTCKHLYRTTSSLFHAGNTNSSSAGVVNAFNVLSDTDGTRGTSSWESSSAALAVAAAIGQNSMNHGHDVAQDNFNRA